LAKASQCKFSGNLPLRNREKVINKRKLKLACFKVGKTDQLHLAFTDQNWQQKYLNNCLVCLELYNNVSRAFQPGQSYDHEI
jgi:hypothetical protein